MAVHDQTAVVGRGDVRVGQEQSAAVRPGTSVTDTSAQLLDGIALVEPQTDAEQGRASQLASPLRPIHSRRQRVLALTAAGLFVLAGGAIARSLFVTSTTTFAAVVEPQQVAQLTFQNAGPLSAVDVQAGQHVHAGQVLATQQTGAQDAVVSADQAALNADEARLTILEHPTVTPAEQTQLNLQLQRAEQEAQAASQNRNAVPGTALAAQTAIALAQNAQSLASASTPAEIYAAQAQIAHDQTQLAADERLLTTMTLVSPINGTVAAVNGSAGEVVSVGRTAAPAITNVPTSPGFSLFPPPPLSQSIGGAGSAYTPVVSVVGTQGWQVVAQVPETAVTQVRPGQRATVSVASLPGQTFSATIKQVEGTPVVVGSAVYYDVLVALNRAAPAGLLTGMTATVVVSGS